MNIHFTLGRILLAAAIASCATSNSSAQAPPSRMVVLGDSVMWGQGLSEDNKIHSRVANLLQDCLGSRPSEILIRAHSGAIIGVGDNTVQTPLPGEIPTSYPTILQQCNNFADSPGTVDLVILNGGANDVGGVRILHPFVPIDVILGDVETHCHQGMTNLLEQASRKFTNPNATIVVNGYYQIISHETPPAFLAALLTGVGVIVSGAWSPVPGMTIGEGVTAVVTLQIHDTIATKCQRFADDANTKLRTAVNEANAVNQGLGRTVRIVFADPRFGPANSMLASQTRLYALNLDLSPQDAVATTRAVQCAQVGSPPAPPRFGCERASMYHPNHSGAQAYADAIFAAFRSTDVVPPPKDIYVRNTSFPGNIPCFFHTGQKDCTPITASGPYQQVTSGIDTAACGDTVNIRAGSYNESFTIRKSLQLKSYEGPATVGRP